MNEIATVLLKATDELCKNLAPLKFRAPITHVYNPLLYASEPHRIYVTRYGNSIKRVMFLGMNPGPFGMAQTGVPFGEVDSVKNWLKIMAPVGKPTKEHPKRPVTGFECPRSEISGKRVWTAAAETFGTPERFFKENYVANYCPLVFMEKSGRNFTPDKLPAAQKLKLYRACDQHLMSLAQALQVQWVVGIGAFAAQRAAEALLSLPQIKIGRILHPSPASPLANLDWAGTIRKELIEQGVYCNRSDS